MWHPCPSQEDCEASGHCSDQSWTTIIRSEDPPEVQYGACFTAGLYFDGPFCFVGTERPGIGCREADIVSPDDCPEFEVVNDGIRWWWRTWLVPAMSEEECVNQRDGRYGCQLPGPEKTLMWLKGDDCECFGGYTAYAWEWTTGVWTPSGVSRTLEWKEIAPVEKYQWTPSLSFELLQTWLELNEEQRFSFAVKSEVICENGYVLSPLNVLVCDCFSGSNETIAGGSSCYSETSVEEVQLVGIGGACFQEQSFVKGPSSRVSFELDSIQSGCTLVNLSIVSEAWFVVPPPRPSISFEFDDKPQRGIVLNQKGATVGILRGDGSVLSFSVLENVNSFSACLLISDDTLSNSSKYPIHDFGYSKQSIGTIYPLGLSNVNSTSVFGSLFWCGTIVMSDIPVDGNNVRLFPIQRVEDYETEEEEYTSRKTRALMYTLGVCYCICFVLLCFYLINTLRSPTTSPMLGTISFLLVILCVFRAVFMFGYPNGIFDGNELAEFCFFRDSNFLVV